MGRNGFMGTFQGIDAFGKTLEDVKIRTRTGALCEWATCVTLTRSDHDLVCDYSYIDNARVGRLQTYSHRAVDCC